MRKMDASEFLEFLLMDFGMKFFPGKRKVSSIVMYLATTDVQVEVRDMRVG